MGVIPRTVGRGGRCDVLVYERAVVTARVPGLDPATLGFILGMPVSGVLGYVVGDYVGAGGDAQRVAELAASDPDAVARRHRRNRVVPIDGIASGSVVTYGAAGGRMRLRDDRGERIARRWTRPHTRGLDVGALLGHTLGRRVPVRRGNVLRPYLPAVALATLVVVALGLSIVAAVLGAVDRADLRAAQAEVAPVCRQFIDFERRAAEGTMPSQVELTTLFDTMSGPFASAARRWEAMEPASDAVGRMQRFARAGPAAAATTDRSAFHDDFVTIWAACNGLTAAEAAGGGGMVGA